MPAGWLFGNIARLRRWAYHKGIIRSYKAEIPVICVGNIAIGGTGKTPHASFITRCLSRFAHVAMLSRGYGRKSKGFVLANATPSAELSANLIGDEPLLLHQRFPALPLAVAENREEGIRRLLTFAPDTDVIVMDDAYQHLSVTPSLRIILTEYNRPYFRDYPMPAGRLREFPDAVRDADCVLVTKVPDDSAPVDREFWRYQLGLAPHQPLFFTRYTYASPEPVTEQASRIMLTPDANIVLLTGIANPSPLYEHLRQRFHSIKHVRFPDHHNYSESDIQHIRESYFSKNVDQPFLLTTEKDWMRLQTERLKKSVSLLPVFILPIEVGFVFEDDRQEFINILKHHVRRTEEKN
jgi:tetraacyldisaccharide 4'-kinase